MKSTMTLTVVLFVVALAFAGLQADAQAAQQDSRLSISLPAGSSNIVLRWGTSPGGKYSLQSASTIQSPAAWNEVTNFIASGTTAAVVRQLTSPQQFFRVQNQTPLQISTSITNNSRLTNVASIPFDTSATGQVAYVSMKVWEENGSVTNTVARIDMTVNPTNVIWLDTRNLHSGKAHYLKLETCDVSGNRLLGDGVNWAESAAVRFIPTNSLSLILPPRVGWKFVADIVPSVTSGTWKCVVSNSSFSKQWTGSIASTAKIRVTDTISDFAHTYPGGKFTVYATVTSGQGNSSLIRDIEIDRRPAGTESIFMEDKQLFGGDTNNIPGELFDAMRRLQIECMGVGSVFFNLATTNHDNVPQHWNTMQPHMWGTLSNYLRSGYQRGPTHLYGWVPGVGPWLGPESNKLTVSYLQSLAESNRLSFAILDGHNGLPALRELVGPDKVGRAYLLEWGQFPRFGIAWKGNPTLLASVDDINDWHAQFLRRFRESAFEKDPFDLGIRFYREALAYAKVLDNGSPNPLAPYIETVGCDELYCDETLALTDY